jgi:hypothetical protein
MMRRARRQRKTPCRSPRHNRRRSSNIPPSTKARWQWKLRIAAWLCQLFPVTQFVAEDIKAKSKGQPRWDKMFSPLEVGKNWFYAELGCLAPVATKRGWETKELRDAAGLKKSKSKLADVFSAHCVDSWVLANWFTGGHTKPDNEKMLLIAPIRLYRRQLHMLQSVVGGIRRRQGGTRILGFKKGSLVQHPRHKICYIGGYSEEGITLHSQKNGRRVSRKAKPIDCKLLTFNSWRTDSV